MIPISNYYCFNPSCSAPSHLTTNCRQCGALLQLGRYYAIKRLGQGKFSRTFLAICAASSEENKSDDATQYVIQQYWGDLFELPARGRVDAALVAKLRTIGQHPQLPTVVDYFEQDGIHYLVQDYVDGESLDRTIATKGPFTPTQVWQVLESVLPTLHWIHAHGMIHRDLKPENIICNKSEFRVVGAAIFNVDSPQSAIGSAEYAAPEQLRGKAVFASDLYSLGVICIHLLTGVQPFHLFDATENRWIWRTYWLPDAASSEKYPDRLAQILDRLIDPNLDRRFGSAAAAIATIEQLRGKKIPIPTPAPLITWQNTATLIGHEGLFASVTAVAISSDRRHIASASEDKTVRLWDLDTGKQILVLRGHSQFVQAVAFHPQQSNWLISAGRDRQIKFWDWTTQQQLRTLVGHTQQIHAIAFSPDGTLIASGSADKTLKLWTLSGENTSTFLGHRLAVNAVAFHPVAPLIASASADATIRLWHLDGELDRILTGHTQAVRAIAFSPTGQLLASGGEDKTIRLWDVASGQCCRILPGHSWSISSLVFATDHILTSGSWDKTIKVWQLETGEEIARLIGHTDSISSLALQLSEPINDRAISLRYPQEIALSLRNAVLISGSRDKTIKRWQFSR